MASRTYPASDSLHCMFVQMKCNAQDEAVKFQRFTCRLKERDRIVHNTVLQKGENQVAEMRAGRGSVAIQHHLEFSMASSASRCWFSPLL
ncbi:hypothetical protein SETIT_1G321300v2 [Setaria italica]|uniref:Uncharacterized protein n=1 Tax=Setaria italica TaxID=4555 RepID=A0A368PRW0_SETIT|nr:hypothetical protein SETIT_1G321300v2 [Setaria italica]